MILEEVEKHPQRMDLYRNQIITPHEKVKDKDKTKVKKILLKALEKN